MTSTSSGCPSARPDPAAARAALAVWGEAAVAAHYRRQGYDVLAANWRCPSGELDLVVRAPGARAPVVFVEVKTRRTDRFGTPWEAVTAAKRRRLRRAAAAYLAERNRAGGDRAAALRFDVAAVRPDRRGVPDVEVIEDAF